MRIFLLGIYLLWMNSCGARLPQEVTINRPISTSSDDAFALEGVEFKNLQTGETIDLGRYMKDQQLTWLVLTFGSQGCGVCMDKARYFQANLVQNYDILGANAATKVRLVGVNTDPAKERNQVVAMVQEQGLSHMNWSDPGHEIMMKYFQPGGMGFSVPLTVMLSKKGILWRVSSKDKLSASQIIKKIADTMGQDAIGELPKERQEEPVVINHSLLAKERPDRLDGVEVKSCDGLGSTKALGRLYEDPSIDYRAVLVTSKTCSQDAACQNARSALETWQRECFSLWNKNCQLVLLDSSTEVCGNSGFHQGGKEFYSVFADHFSWGYKPLDAGDGKTILPEVQGVLSFVFDRDGRLVFSREGSIGDALNSRMIDDRLTKREVGPDFSILADLNPGFVDIKVQATAKVSSFSQLREKAKYTMVLFWNTWCSSCSEEIQEWHEDSSSAYRVCEKSMGTCQVVALETKRSETSLSPEDYLQSLIVGTDDFEGWAQKKWQMPLAVDGEMRSDGLAPDGWFDGWVRARVGSVEPMTALFDQEGKMIARWRSLPGEHGPRDYIQKLIEEGSR